MGKEAADFIKRASTLGVLGQGLGSRLALLDGIGIGASLLPKGQGLINTALLEKAFTEIKYEPPRFKVQHFSDTFYENLVETITRFQEGLTSEESVQATYAAPDNGIMEVHRIGYQWPNIITLEGVDDRNHRAMAIVHMAAVSLMLRAIPTQAPAPARRIGFIQYESLPETDAEDDGE